MAEADLSKIVNLIMQNPKLIEEIKGLTNNEEAVAKNDVTPKESKEAVTKQTEEAVSVSEPNLNNQKRRELLSALKPYVSNERAKAIDTMISIADALDIMKAR